MGICVNPGIESMMSAVSSEIYVDKTGISVFLYALFTFVCPLNLLAQIAQKMIEWESEKLVGSG